MALHLLERHRAGLILTVFLSCSAVLQVQGGAADVTTLVPFAGVNGSLKGDGPLAGLLLAADGSFYGTTHQGGIGTPSFPSGLGTVFKLTPSGLVTTLVTFNETNGAQPYAGLAQGVDGNLYGTTWVGGTSGNGTLFRLTTNGSLTTLLSFTNGNGSKPSGRLTLGGDGFFYGTTQFGGSSNLGTVFRVTTNGVLNTLVSFNRSNGAIPNSEVTQGIDGYFYGTTVNGGLSNKGTIFQLRTNGLLTTLISFVGTNGFNPYGGLVQDPSGAFYGTTASGGTAGAGTVFRATTNGAIVTLHSFSDEVDGAEPLATLLRGRDGSYYGTTRRNGAAIGPKGTLFQITTNGVLTCLYSFGSGASDEGGNPYGYLVQDASGDLYGTTRVNGPVTGRKGTVFRVGPAPATLRSSFLGGGLVSVGWEAWLGLQYQVQYKTNLTPNGWVNLGNPVTATNGNMSVTDSVSGLSRYYRLNQLSAP